MVGSKAKSRWLFSKPHPLLVTDSSLNIGDVWESDQHIVNVPITNVTDKDVHIEGFQRSCRCTEVRPSTLTIPGGATKSVEVFVNLVDFAARKRPLNSKSPFEVEIRPIVYGEQAKSGQQSWTIGGQVKRAIAPEMQLITFGRQSAQSLPLPPRSFRIRALPAVDRLEVICGSQNFSATATRSNINPDVFALELQDRGSLATSAFQFEVAVHPIMNGERLPAVRVPVEGTIVPDIHITSPNVAFGAHPIGAVLEDVLTIRSMTKRKFTVISYETVGPGLTILALPDVVSDQTCFRVRQEVSSGNDQNGEIRFLIRDDLNIERKLTVATSHYGLPSNRHLAAQGPTQ